MPFTHFDDLDLLGFTNELKIKFINFYFGSSSESGKTVYPHARLIFFLHADHTIFFHDPEKDYPIRSGDWLLIPPFVPVRHDLNEAALHLSLHFTLQAYEGFDMLSGKEQIVQHHSPGRIERIKCVLADQSKMDLALLFQEVCWTCLHEVKDVFPAFHRISQLYRDQEAVRLIRLITRHVRPDFSIRELAELSGLNSSVIVKKMIRATGMPPGRFMDRMLADRAAVLLMKGNLSVKETACRCGFRDPYGFSRFFSRMTGSAPSEFRKRYQLLHTCTCDRLYT